MRVIVTKLSPPTLTIRAETEDGKDADIITKLVLILGGAVKVDLGVAVSDLRVGQSVTLDV